MVVLGVLDSGGGSNQLSHCMARPLPANTQKLQQWLGILQAATPADGRRRAVGGIGSKRCYVVWGWLVLWVNVQSEVKKMKHCASLYVYSYLHI